MSQVLLRYTFKYRCNKTMARLFPCWMIITFIFWIVYSADGVRVRRAFCSTSRLDIPNGDYKIGQGYSSAEYTCDQGFQLYGVNKIACIGTNEWSSAPPACVANTCEKIKHIPALRIREELNGAVLKLSCDPLYKLEGSAKLLCNGTAWSTKTPLCNPWNPPLSCDFEKQDLCGWYHDEAGGEQWNWHTGNTSTSGTGPSYDHTFGPDRNGHYLYFESSQGETNDQAVLSSPLFPSAYSTGYCFSFWYHIHGSNDIGDLKVFFRPDGGKLNSLEPVFHVNKTLDDQWYQATTQLSSQNSAFQIVFVASRNINGTKTYKSDFAIDDVRLEGCKESTSLPSKSPSTSKYASTFTTRSSTIVQTSKVRIITTRSNEEITRVETTYQKSTRQQATNAATYHVTTSQTAISSSSPQQTSAKSSASGINITTTTHMLQPKINPDLPTLISEVHTPKSEDHISKVVYIVIGMGIVLAVVVVAGIGMYVYRWRMRYHILDWNGFRSENPLYRVMANEEDTVHFVTREQTPANHQMNHSQLYNNTT